MTNLFDLTGQKALVTGGTGSLGIALAQGLHDAGAALALHGTTDRARAAAEEMGRAGAPVHGVVADLSDRAELGRMFADAVRALGGLDVLLLAHGIIQRVPSEQFPLEDWDRTLEVNLTACFELSQLAARHMLPNGRGKIILIGSVIGFQGGHTIPAYAASKGGIIGLTMALSNDWAARGVNVNAIAPGYMISSLNATLREDPVRSRQILERIPAGRWGRPDELQGAAVFLASRASDYVNGIVLPVDGGWLAR